MPPKTSIFGSIKNAALGRSTAEAPNDTVTATDGQVVKGQQRAADQLDAGQQRAADQLDAGQKDRQVVEGQVVKGQQRAADPLDAGQKDGQGDGANTSPKSCGETNPIINGFSLDTSYSPLVPNPNNPMIDGVIMNKTILKYHDKTLVEVSTPYNTCKTNSGEQDKMKKIVTNYLLNVVINICNIIKETVFEEETKAPVAEVPVPVAGPEPVPVAGPEPAPVAGQEVVATGGAAGDDLLKSIIGIPKDSLCRKIDVTTDPTPPRGTDTPPCPSITIKTDDYTEPFTDNFNQNNCARKIINYLKNNVLIHKYVPTTSRSDYEVALYTLHDLIPELKAYKDPTFPVILDKKQQINFIQKTIDVLNNLIRYAHIYIYKTYIPSYKNSKPAFVPINDNDKSALVTSLKNLVDLMPKPKKGGGSNMNYSTPRKMRKTENRRFKNKRPKRKNTAKRYR
jgi:hypothetical protein